MIRLLTRMSLRAQGRVVLFVCVLTGTLLTISIAAHYEGEMHRAALESRARVLAGTVASSSVRPLLDYDVVALDDIVEAARGLETGNDLAYLIVTDASGRVLAHSRGYEEYGRLYDDPASRNALTSTADELVQEPGGGILEISRPVVVGHKRWGTVRVGLSLAPLDAAIRTAWKRTLVIALVIAVLIGGLASLLTRPVFLNPIYQLQEATRKLAEREFDHRIEHTRKDEFGRLFDGVNAVAVMMQDREKLYAQFGRYVTNKVRDAILSGAVSPKGKNVRAAILFADLRGFTARCERLPAEEVLALLNTYCSRMTTAIHAHDGIVDKFIGDAVMAVFGVPFADPDCAKKSVMASQAMRAELDAINLELAREGKEPLRMGIGLHVGECVAGSVGAPTRMQYTVVGDAVNLASRLQALTKKMSEETIVSEDVVHDCGPWLITRDLGSVSVEGRDADVHVFAVEATRLSKSRTDEAMELERQRERDSAN